METRQIQLVVNNEPDESGDENGSCRFNTFHDAGQVLMGRERASLQARMRRRYHRAEEPLIVAAAEAALRNGRRYDDCRSLTDDVLDQAIRTTIRHELLGYESTLSVLGGRLDDDLHKRIQAAFWHIADIVANEFTKPKCAMTGGRKPNHRRVWPPRVGFKQ